MQQLKPERDNELYRAFKSAFARSDIHTFKQAVRHAVNSPCSQFYVSPEEAYRFINAKQKRQDTIIDTWRDGTHPISKHKLRAFQLIYQRYLELRDHFAFRGCSTMFISSFACSSPAPCFFISYRRALEIIRQMRKHGKVSHRKRYDKK